MPPDLPTRLARKWTEKCQHKPDKYDFAGRISFHTILCCDCAADAVREALEEAEKIVQSTGWFVLGPFGQGRVAAAIAALRKGFE